MRTPSQAPICLATSRAAPADLVRPVVALGLLLVLAPSLIASDWPQWRGPQSNGVSPVSRAPEHWSETSGVAWRAEIEGHGISSPVIRGQHVYVTTAMTLRQQPAARAACDYLVGLVALLGIPALVRYWWKCNITKPNTDSLSRTLHVLDIGLFFLLAVGLFVFGVLVALGPAAVDAGVDALREVAVALARSLGRAHTNLSFLNWDGGTAHNTWIISSAVALASLALIPFFLAHCPALRLRAALLLMFGTVLATSLVPWPAAYAQRQPIGALVVLYSPVLALALWHAVQSVVSRIRHADLIAPVKGRAHLCASVPALLSVGMLMPPNYLQSEEVVTRRLVCFDAVTGQRVWHTDIFAAPPETKSRFNSHATPTPSVAENMIVAAFGVGVAAVTHDGQLQWSKTLPTWVQNSVYGAASSPVVDGGTVFVATDREFEGAEPSRVVAYSLQSGTELWAHTPQFAHDGYATPVIHHDGARKVLIAISSKVLVGYDAATGAVAWTLPTPIPQPVPSLILEGESLYVTGGKGADGYTAGYRLRRSEAPEEMWTSRRHAADVSSPVVYKGRLYTISSTGIIVSYDARSGEVVWRHRLRTRLGNFYASLVAADDKIYAVNSNGTTFVVAADDKFRVISESSLPEEIYASPAFGADCLILRTVSAVYCIR